MLSEPNAGPRADQEAAAPALLRRPAVWVAAGGGALLLSVGVAVLLFKSLGPVPKEFKPADYQHELEQHRRHHEREFDNK